MPVNDQSDPTAAIVIIGDEILSGRTADSNINTIAKFLNAIGVDLTEVRVVGDTQAQIVRTLNDVRHQYDYVFTTGGIGPTHDDITADCVAAAFGVPINERQDALDILLERYGGDASLLNPNSRRMARIPEGASLILNPVSGAPGFQLDNVFVMAGVPRIMAGMLNDVAPRLRQGRKVLSRTIKATYVRRKNLPFDNAG
ncbi:MAG: competence/damage-inducible protein A, partial [Asticcacaulis sp.]